MFLFSFNNMKFSLLGSYIYIYINKCDVNRKYCFILIQSIIICCNCIIVCSIMWFGIWMYIEFISLHIPFSFTVSSNRVMNLLNHSWSYFIHRGDGIAG